MIIFITIIHEFMFLSHFWRGSVCGASFSQNQAISVLVICLQLIKSSFTAEKFELPPCLHALDAWGVSTDRFSYRCATVETFFYFG